MLVVWDSINILLVITAVLNLLLGMVTFFNGPRKKANIFYSAICVSLIAWVLGMIFYRSSSSEYDMFWCTALYVFATFIPSIFLYFTYVFPSEKNGVSLLKPFFIFILNLIIVIMVVWPGFIIKEVNVRIGQEKEIIFTKYYWFYFVYISSLFFYGFYRLYNKYRRSVGIERQQIFYLLGGDFLSANGAFVTNLIMPWLGYFALNWLGQVFTITMVSFAAYAIIRYRFMDTRIVARRLFIYLGIAAFAYAIFYLIVWFYEKYFGGVFTTISYVAGLVVAPLFVLSFYGLEKGLSRFSNKYLFASLYNYQTAINKLIDEVNYHIDLDKVVHLIAKTIQEAMKIKGVSVTLIDLAANNAIIKTINIDKANALPAANGAVVGFLNNRPKPIVIEELEIAYEKEESPKIKSDLKALISEMKNCQKCSLILPLVSNKRVVGVILLGKRQGGDPYTHEDLDFLEILSKQAGIAVENALLYKKTNQFNDMLKQKVNEQTADLKKKNVHLEKLLQMRTEFLDIASHQLKTPVSVIRGTASMFVDGSMDKVSEAERKKFFKNIYDKATKLNVITSDILRASELDTDEFKIDPKLARPAQVKEVLQSVYDDLKELADEKKIGLELSLPKKNPPELLTSPDFFEQAIYNLVDNAIKYTKTGAVKMSLEQLGNDLIIKVSDSGIGIPKKDQKKIFDKFARASNAINMYADGSGLGLFIVKKIIEAHPGSKITFESEEGKGTTFTVVLGVK